MNALFQNMKLSRKLMLAPATIIVFLLLLALVSYVGLSSQKDATTDVYNKRFKQYQDSARVQHEINQAHASVYKVLSWAGANFDQSRIDKLAREQIVIIDRNLATLQKMLQASDDDADGKKKFQNTIDSMTIYKKTVAETTDFVASDIGLANTYMSIAEKKFQTLTGHMNELLEYEAKLSTHHFSMLLDSFDKLLLILGGAILLVVVISLYTSKLVNNNILDSLGGEPTYVAEIASEVASGNLALQIETDEEHTNSLLAVVKNMVASLNQMVSKVERSTAVLSQISGKLTNAADRVVGATQIQASGISETSSAINEISASLKEVANLVNNLSSSAAETASSILEMSASNNEVSQNMDTLSESIEEVSSSILQMSTTIRQVSGGVTTLMDASSTTASSVTHMNSVIKQVEKHANDTAQITDAVRQDAEIGKRAVEATISGIGEIKRSARITSEVISTLSERVHNIGAILAVIDDVAKQTNLLALNAAIIAAQAGEHGKGFAVVAGEIKLLAERTTASTHEIGMVIRGVQDETSRAVEAMSEAEMSITSGEELSAKAGASLNKIVTEAQLASGQMAEIAQATVEQARGSQSISDAMQQVSDLVGQFANASREQAQGSELIITAVERMKELSFQVRSSTREQNKVGSMIAQSTSNITGMIQQIKRAADEQSRGSEQIVAAVENIQQSAQVNLDSTAIMNESATSLARQVQLLSQEMKAFKV